MQLSVLPLTDSQIREMIAWRYEGEYAMYNIQPENMETEIAFFSEPANGYFAIVNGQNEFIGFCNFGEDARVPGGDYYAQAIDIGMGLRPDLTGQGHGTEYAQAVFDFARKHFPSLPHRVTIAAFNCRAQRVCEKHGYQRNQMFVGEKDGKEFVVMTREEK